MPDDTIKETLATVTASGLDVNTGGGDSRTVKRGLSVAGDICSGLG